MTDDHAVTGNGNTKIYYLELLAEPSQSSALYGQTKIVLALSFVAASDPRAAHRALRSHLFDLALKPGGNGDLLKRAEVMPQQWAEVAATEPSIATAVKTQGAHLCILNVVEGASEWPDITDKVVASVLLPDDVGKQVH